MSASIITNASLRRVVTEFSDLGHFRSGKLRLEVDPDLSITSTFSVSAKLSRRLSPWSARCVHSVYPLDARTLSQQCGFAQVIRLVAQQLDHSERRPFMAAEEIQKVGARNEEPFTRRQAFHRRLVWSAGEYRVQAQDLAGLRGPRLQLVTRAPRNRNPGSAARKHEHSGRRLALRKDPRPLRIESRPLEGAEGPWDCQNRPV